MDPGAEIKIRRERLGMSQEELSQLTGASVEAISNWERGVNKPRQLARVLAVLDRAEAEARGVTDVADVRVLADDELWRRTREHLAEIERRYHTRSGESRPLPGGTGDVPPHLRRRLTADESTVDDRPDRTGRSNGPNG